MKKLQSRRDFLKSAGKIAAGAALLSTGLSPAMAETKEEEPKVDFHWKADALPCELIKEVTDKVPEGMRSFEYKPDNRAHITRNRGYNCASVLLFYSLQEALCYHWFSHMCQ